MYEIAAYLPKLEKLAACLHRLGINENPAKKSSKKSKSLKPAMKRKIVLVKKPVVPETPVMTGPMFRQPGMVYVPATWVKKNPHKTTKKRESAAISSDKTAIISRRRHTVPTDQNVLVQKSPRHRTIKRMSPEIALKADAKKAAVALERKRLEFLQYLQEIREEISAIGFSGKISKKGLRKKKEDATKLKPTKRTSKYGKGKPNNTGGLTKKIKAPAVEYPKNAVKPVLSKVVESNQHSLTSMLSQDSSSSTQIRMMDDAFNSNHRNYKASTNESKQTRVNLGGPMASELPGFFQWTPIPNCRSTSSSIKIS